MTDTRVSDERLAEFERYYNSFDRPTEWYTEVRDALRELQRLRGGPPTMLFSPQPLTDAEVAQGVEIPNCKHCGRNMFDHALDIQRFCVTPPPESPRTSHGR